MGIEVALLAPDAPDGSPTAPGLDPFTSPKDTSGSCKSGGLPAGRLCDKGVVTHGHLPEAEDYGGPSGSWSAGPGPAVSQVSLANFLYLPGDLSTIGTTGVPRVKLGTKLRFVNADGGGIYHTITTCAFPCLG